MVANISRFQRSTLSTALFACAGLLCARSSWGAATTSLQMQVSLDGQTWSNNVVVNPGTVVDIRAVVSFVANDSTTVPIGLAALNMQPTISNWTPQSQLRPFAASGNNLNGGAVVFTNTTSGPYGRSVPFGATGPTTVDPYMGHTQTVSGTSYLRLARSTITNWVGQGVTTGSDAANNFNGAGGIVLAQKSVGQRTAQDPAFSFQLTDLVVFKFSVLVSSLDPVNEMTVDAPLEGLIRNAATGSRAASWFTAPSDNFGSLKADISVSTATILQVPAPSTALGLLGAVSAFNIRRRRAR